MPSSASATSNSATCSNNLIPSGISAVALRTIHGQLHESNYLNGGSVDFSCNNIAAFACQTVIMVVDCKSRPLRTIQSLHGHGSVVTRVKFPRDNSLKLASSDIRSTLIVWDVLRGSKTCTINPECKETKAGIVSFDWLTHGTSNCSSTDSPGSNSQHQHQPNQSTTTTITSSSGANQSILVLYASHLLILYDSGKGNTIWRKNLSNQSPSASSSLTSAKNIFFSPSGFSLDPFTESNLVIPLTPMNPSQIQCSFLHTSDIHSTSPLTLKRYHIFVTDLIQPQSLDKSPDMRLGMRIITSSSAFSKPTEDDEDASQFKMEMRQVLYSRNQRDQVAVASSRVVTIIDLNLNEILVTIPLERSLSNLLDIWPCEMRNCLYTLHKSGCVILRLFQKKIFFDDSRGTQLLEPSYKSLASSSCLKLPKNVSVAGFAVSPIEETLIVILLTSGKLISIRVGQEEPLQKHCQALFDVIPESWYHFDDSKSIGLIHMNHDQDLPPLSKITVIKSCPPVTKSNWSEHRPLVAMGTASGVIQVYDMSTGLQEHCLPIHSSTVRGIEWVSLSAVLSFSYSKAIQVTVGSNQHKWKTNNELVLTDLKSGINQVIRKEKNADFSPIEMVRVSHLKQFFIITFKDEPFEIWDLKKLSLIKIMSKFSHVTCVEWSPISAKSKSNECANAISQSEVEIKNKQLLSHILPPSSTASTDNEFSRENFIFNNISNGDLIHYSVDGTTTKEISCIKGDSSHGILTAIAWKGEQIILSFADGFLLFWDLKKKTCVPKSTHKESVKKIKFGPGKGNANFLVLHSDSCLQLWDMNTLASTSELKKVQDMDWIASDRPVLLMSDGSLCVTDLSLNRYSSSISLSEKSDPNDLNLNWNLVRSATRFKLIASYSLPSMDQIDAKELISRCITVAILTGNKHLLKFWQLVSHHLLDEALDSSFDLLLKHEAYRKLQQESLALFEYKRISSCATGLEMCTEYHLLFKNHQRAVQLLLDSCPSGLGKQCNSNGDAYYKNALKACLIAALPDQTSSTSSEQSSPAEPVIKLVAASLIASGSLDQGVQLLLLIGKVQDACRYLQSQGQFKKCAWIAKTCLDCELVDEVVRRSLLQLEQGPDPLFVHLSTGSLAQILAILLQKKELATAALFALVCDKKSIKWSNSANECRREVFDEYRKCLYQHQQLSSLLQVFSSELDTHQDKSKVENSQ